MINARPGTLPWYGVQLVLWDFMSPDMKPYVPPRRYFKRHRKGGRPRACDRKAFAAILWMATTGGKWKTLPKRFGSARTAQRRLNRWLWCGRLEKMFSEYLRHVSDDEIVHWDRAFRRASSYRKLYWTAMLALQLGWHYRTPGLLSKDNDTIAT